MTRAPWLTNPLTRTRGTASRGACHNNRLVHNKLPVFWKSEGKARTLTAGRTQVKWAMLVPLATGWPATRNRCGHERDGVRRPEHLGWCCS